MQLPVIPLGIDTDRFDTAVDNEKRAAQRRHIGAAEEDTVILFYGRPPVEQDDSVFFRRTDMSTLGGALFIVDGGVKSIGVNAQRDDRQLHGWQVGPLPRCVPERLDDRSDGA